LFTVIDGQEHNSCAGNPILSFNPHESTPFGKLLLGAMVQFESLKNIGGGEMVQELAAAKEKDMMGGKTKRKTVKSFDIVIVIAKVCRL